MKNLVLGVNDAIYRACVIVAALAMKVRQLARVAAAGGRRMSPAELGMAPWQVDRARRELQGWSDDDVALVKISTSTPRRARRCAVCHTYTFMPPASPVPGCANGEVCTETSATRRGPLKLITPL